MLRHYQLCDSAFSFGIAIPNPRSTLRALSPIPKPLTRVFFKPYTITVPTCHRMLISVNAKADSIQVLAVTESTSILSVIFQRRGRSHSNKPLRRPLRHPRRCHQQRSYRHLQEQFIAVEKQEMETSELGSVEVNKVGKFIMYGLSAEDTGMRGLQQW